MLILGLGLILILILILIPHFIVRFHCCTLALSAYSPPLPTIIQPLCLSSLINLNLIVLVFRLPLKLSLCFHSPRVIVLSSLTLSYCSYFFNFSFYISFCFVLIVLDIIIIVLHIVILFLLLLRFIMFVVFRVFHEVVGDFLSFLLYFLFLFLFSFPSSPSFSSFDCYFNTSIHSILFYSSRNIRFLLH